MPTQAKINKSVAVSMIDLFKKPTNPLRAKENPVDLALAANAAAIRKALDMGYSLRAIVLTLRDAGLPASPKTIAKHLRQVVLGQTAPQPAPVARIVRKQPATRKQPAMRKATVAAVSPTTKRGAEPVATQKAPRKRSPRPIAASLARSGKS